MNFVSQVGALEYEEKYIYVAQYSEPEQKSNVKMRKREFKLLNYKFNTNVKKLNKGVVGSEKTFDKIGEQNLVEDFVKNLLNYKPSRYSRRQYDRINDVDNIIYRVFKTYVIKDVLNDPTKSKNEILSKTKELLNYYDTFSKVTNPTIYDLNNLTTANQAAIQNIQNLEEVNDMVKLRSTEYNKVKLNSYLTKSQQEELNKTIYNYHEIELTSRQQYEPKEEKIDKIPSMTTKITNKKKRKPLRVVPYVPLFPKEDEKQKEEDKKEEEKKYEEKKYEEKKYEEKKEEKKEEEKKEEEKKEEKKEEEKKEEVYYESIVPPSTTSKNEKPPRTFVNTSINTPNKLKRKKEKRGVDLRYEMRKDNINKKRYIVTDKDEELPTIQYEELYPVVVYKYQSPVEEVKQTVVDPKGIKKIIPTIVGPLSDTSLALSQSVNHTNLASAYTKADELYYYSLAVREKYYNIHSNLEQLRGITRHADIQLDGEYLTKSVHWNKLPEGTQMKDIEYHIKKFNTVHDMRETLTRGVFVNEKVLKDIKNSGSDLHYVNDFLRSTQEEFTNLSKAEDFLKKLETDTPDDVKDRGRRLIAQFTLEDKNYLYYIRPEAALMDEIAADPANIDDIVVNNVAIKASKTAAVVGEDYLYSADKKALAILENSAAVYYLEPEYLEELKEDIVRADLRDHVVEQANAEVILDNDHVNQEYADVEDYVDSDDNVDARSVDTVEADTQAYQLEILKNTTQQIIESNPLQQVVAAARLSGFGESDVAQFSVLDPTDKKAMSGYEVEVLMGDQLMKNDVDKSYKIKKISKYRQLKYAGYSINQTFNLYIDKPDTANYFGPQYNDTQMSEVAALPLFANTAYIPNDPIGIISHVAQHQGPIGVAQLYAGLYDPDGVHYHSDLTVKNGMANDLFSYLHPNIQSIVGPIHKAYTSTYNDQNVREIGRSKTMYSLSNQYGIKQAHSVMSKTLEQAAMYLSTGSKPFSMYDFNRQAETNAAQWFPSQYLPITVANYQLSSSHLESYTIAALRARRIYEHQKTLTNRAPFYISAGFIPQQVPQNNSSAVDKLISTLSQYGVSHSDVLKFKLPYSAVMVQSAIEDEIVTQYWNDGDSTTYQYRNDYIKDAALRALKIAQTNEEIEVEGAIERAVKSTDDNPKIIDSMGNVIGDDVEMHGSIREKLEDNVRRLKVEKAYKSRADLQQDIKEKYVKTELIASRLQKQPELMRGFNELMRQYVQTEVEQKPGKGASEEDLASHHESYYLKKENLSTMIAGLIDPSSIVRGENGELSEVSKAFRDLVSDDITVLLGANVNKIGKEKNASARRSLFDKLVRYSPDKVFSRILKGDDIIRSEFDREELKVMSHTMGTYVENLLNGLGEDEPELTSKVLQSQQLMYNYDSKDFLKGIGTTKEPHGERALIKYNLELKLQQKGDGGGGGGNGTNPTAPKSRAMIQARTDELEKQLEGDTPIDSLRREKQKLVESTGRTTKALSILGGSFVNTSKFTELLHPKGIYDTRGIYEGGMKSFQKQIKATQQQQLDLNIEKEALNLYTTASALDEGIGIEVLEHMQKSVDKDGLWDLDVYNKKIKEGLVRFTSLAASATKVKNIIDPAIINGLYSLIMSGDELSKSNNAANIFNGINVPDSAKETSKKLWDIMRETVDEFTDYNNLKIDDLYSALHDQEAVLNERIYREDMISNENKFSKGVETILKGMGFDASTIKYGLLGYEYLTHGIGAGAPGGGGGVYGGKGYGSRYAKPYHYRYRKERIGRRPWHSGQPNGSLIQQPAQESGLSPMHLYRLLLKGAIKTQQNKARGNAKIIRMQNLIEARATKAALARKNHRSLAISKKRRRK